MQHKYWPIKQRLHYQSPSPLLRVWVKFGTGKNRSTYLSKRFCIPWSRIVPGSAFISCLHWVWERSIQGKDSLEHLEGLRRSDPNFAWFVHWTSTNNRWGCGCAGTIHYPALWPNVQYDEQWWSSPTVIYKERSSYGCHSPNQNCILKGLCTKVDTAGARCSKLPSTAIPWELGMSWPTTVNQCGLPCLKPVLHPENYFLLWLQERVHGMV